VVSKSFWTVIVVTALVKEDEWEAMVTLPQACHISLQHETML
jgi:hypothetical protein